MKPSARTSGYTHHPPRDSGSPAPSFVTSEEGHTRRNGSEKKNRGIHTPNSKPRHAGGVTPSRSPNPKDSEELFSVEAVGCLLTEVSIDSPTHLYRSSPNHQPQHRPSPIQRFRPVTPKHGHYQSSERPSPFKPTFETSPGSHQRSISSMISTGGISSTKVSIYVNASRCKLDAKRFSELLKLIVTNHILPHRDPVTQEQKKSLRILKFDLSSNILDDSAVAKLVGFIRQHAANLTINSMKLYQNKIGDEGCEALAALIARDDGPTFHELHLSHNRITSKGAKALVCALADCPRYPFGKDQERRMTPLWLRLEHNFISAPRILDELKLKKCCSCLVNAKGSACTPSNCQTPNAKLHLVFLHFQYWNESLESAKKAMEEIRANSLKNVEAIESPTITNPQIPQSSTPTPQETIPVKDASRPVSSVAGVSAVSKDNDIQAGPLYLFMDTNAVITAVLEPKHPWSFINLKKRFQSPENAALIQGGKRVVLVVTDTVLGELDGMHKKKVVKASVVNELLMDAEKQGYLMMLGAHQGEKIVQALDGPMLGMDITTSNDRMIVDIALMFAEELGDPHCAMFISEDHGARLTARNRGLCTVSMSQLQIILPKKQLEPWSSDNLKRWFLTAAPTKDMTLDSPSPAVSPAPRSNPISQLRSLKTSALKAIEITNTLSVPEDQLTALAELNTLLEHMARTLQHISVLPNRALFGNPKTPGASTPQPDENRKNDSADDYPSEEESNEIALAQATEAEND